MDDHIYGRGHLSGDLKWRQAEMRGIIIFPMMQQLSLLKFLILYGDIINTIIFHLHGLAGTF